MTIHGVGFSARSRAGNNDKTTAAGSGILLAMCHPHAGSPHLLGFDHGVAWQFRMHLIRDPDGSKLPKADMERRPQKLPLFTTRIRASGRSLKRFTACWPRLCKSLASVLATLAVAVIWARN